MFPMSDANPRLTRPVVTLALVAVTTLIFFGFQARSSQDVTAEHSVIPCELITGEPISARELQTQECVLGDSPLFPNKSIALSVVASIFLHGSVAHLLGNMWVLWIFGNNVEDAFGRVAYLLFYLLSGVVAVAGFVFVHPTFAGPLIGASGAVAGLLGAYLVLFPRTKIRVLLGFFPMNVPAFLFVLVWFGSQFLITQGAVAWEAHVAGSVFGAVGALLVRGPALDRLSGLSRDQPSSVI